ncbi:DDB1- and CUL4-associated factor 12 [Striga asiatica]|uniref:DDB1-and CUL4-associated factor 12 n=1 Tax=Striga asiatica TaxID=4170 RepID=A0A5A7QZ63_STRAF|nr:DDB1- and CUL4-associated factor 12 [Striga asiatica]
MGRLLGLGLRQDRATMAMAQTSSKRSSSIIRVGSTMLVTESLSYMLTWRRVESSHSLVAVGSAVGELIPIFPVTSSRRIFPKQWTSYEQVAFGLLPGCFEKKIYMFVVLFGSKERVDIDMVRDKMSGINLKPGPSAAPIAIFILVIQSNDCRFPSGPTFRNRQLDKSPFGIYLYTKNFSSSFSKQCPNKGTNLEECETLLKKSNSFLTNELESNFFTTTGTPPSSTPRYKSPERPFFNKVDSFNSPVASRIFSYENESSEAASVPWRGGGGGVGPTMLTWLPPPPLGLVWARLFLLHTMIMSKASPIIISPMPPNMEANNIMTNLLRLLLLGREEGGE